MKTILVPLDGSALAEQALPYVRTLAPLLGEHNEYVLTSVLAYTEDEIAQLVVDGVVF